jgi:hypothetical protein
VIPAGNILPTIYETPIPFEELLFDASAIIHALGYDGTVPEPVTAIIRSVLPTLGSVVEASGGFRIIEYIRVSVPDGVLFCGDVEFAVERMIASQLRDCTAVAVFTVTAGAELERWSKERTDDEDILTGYILDVIGSEVAECAVQWLEEKLDAFLRPQALGSTTRYSPGYCGWNVSEQKKLFSLLPENFCGISLTESSLMLPIKSVSGIIGVGPSAKKEGYLCSACEDEDCLYRK